MILTCNCLNVSIKTKGSTLQPVNIDDKDLNLNEQDSEFFTNVSSKYFYSYDEKINMFCRKIQILSMNFC